jgi:localization factor PodJL
MNSRALWSNEGIDPVVRERAESAARRAGVSLSDWLNSALGDSGPANFRQPSDQRQPVTAQQGREVADIHQRLDAITRQIERISQGRQRQDVAPGEPPVARQLNDAIARLDARLAQISSPHPAAQRQMQDPQHRAEMMERAAAQVHRTTPARSSMSLDSAIAEISARQSELDSASPPPALRDAPPIAPAAPAHAPPVAPAGPDFSSLERHLVKITSQIESLRRPDHLDQSIAAFRSELAEIRHAITEAMPRRAIESIEGEIRQLARRIDDNRQSGIDGQALASIERALADIREVLRSLTPAEQLAGYDEAIRNLTAKLDQILRANDDPSTIHQLEGAIAALRAIVSNIASNDALARLSEDVHTLSAKVDQLARAGNPAETLATLEQRIAALASSLEKREERPAIPEGSTQIENALRALSDRLDRMPVGNDNASALTHLEQRVSYLLERLEASADHRSTNLGRVEEGLQEILQHLERQHANMAEVADRARSDGPVSDNGLADIVKRELSDIRFSQAETERHTQNSLEAVHSTLGHVVDRLAMIEGDLRSVRIQPATVSPATSEETSERATLAPTPAPEPAYAAPFAAAPDHPEAPASQTLAVEPQSSSEMPDLGTMHGSFEAAPRDFPPAPTLVTPKSVSDILEPHVASSRIALEPDLPPDHPLEPGTRSSARAASPSERIAASEDAISEIPPPRREPVSTSSFIAAARRAAQAAAAAPPPEKSGRASKISAGGLAKGSSAITSKIRSLLVGASVVIIVLGTFKMAMTLLDKGNSPAIESSTEQPSALPEGESALPAVPAERPGSMTSPTPIGRQSFNHFVPGNAEDGASVAILENSPAAASTVDITGAIPSSQSAIGNAKYTAIAIPPTERLPDAIGGPVLRAAVLKGDAAAAYEVGVRFAEGKGVAPNFDEAAKWLDRAARAGVAPAIFRLGTFYEKGLGVKKDLDIARRYYVQAAERGNAKAMHNLAVLDADGGGKGANYASAAQWFRKAADRGVGDSQYNLGILYARGIGVEQNLAESLKWFSLAAAQGDADAGRKGDEVAKRLDPQSLAAARLAIQTFTPEPQPDDAVTVAAPAGGWDSAPAPTGNAKPAAKPAASKRTASAR